MHRRPAAAAAPRRAGASEFRPWLLGKVLPNLGTWMQRTAQDWLVLVDVTHHSGLAIGVKTALQYVPILLLSTHAGALADR